MKRLFTSLNELAKGTRKADTVPTFRALATDPEDLVIEMYGIIGASMWDDSGITAQQVSEALKNNNHPKVTVRINSPGGNMFEGLTIYNVLKSSGKLVHVIVDGLAASAASLIAMAGNIVDMQAGTMMMIHPAQMFAMGSSVDMREAADVLEKATGQMAEVYAARSGQTKEKLLEMMYTETWMTPGEAKDLGFADNLSEGEGNAKAVAAAYNLSEMYAKTPESLKTFKPEPEPKGTPMTDLAARELELYGVGIGRV